MAYDAPTKEEWRALYDAAIAVKALAPWTFIAETEVFGVQNPETDELGFVSVMGSGGEHYAVALYLGASGLHSFWGMQDTGSDMRLEDVLNTPHLQASFEDRKQLRDEDYQTIRALGLKFRGRNAWPRFRSYRPGSYALRVVPGSSAV